MAVTRSQSTLIPLSLRLGDHLIVRHFCCTPVRHQEINEPSDVLKSNAPPPRRLPLAIAGLGRMGKQHAMNALHASPRVQLTAVSTPSQPELEWADQQLAPHGVQVHKSLETMLSDGKAEALLIASATKVHHEQVMAGIGKGMHVLCEKPLAMNSRESRDILETANHPRHWHLKIMTAFSRRFDASYNNAADAIKAGRIGEPVAIRFENRDLYERTESMIRYLKANPGILIDSGVHDIDLSFRFLGDDARPRSAYATGSVSLHQELKAIKDADTAVGIVEWYARSEGEPAPITYYHCSRLMRHGFDNPTEIIGTEGVLKVNMHPRRDLVSVADRHGIGNTVMPDYFERYERAFVTELNAFADCVLDDKALPYDLSVAVRGMEIAEALQESLRTGRKISWDEHGVRTD